MAELKTIPTQASVEKFLKGIQDEEKQADCYQILDMMKKATRAEPKMWGTSIVGFGRAHYVYNSGRVGDWFMIGFSPRKQYLSLYFMCNLDQLDGLLEQLGKHSTGKGCLYINKLTDVDRNVLKKIIARSVKAAGKFRK